MFCKCNKCGKLLTEFDVNFTKNLKGSFDKKSCECANCLANTDYLSNMKKPNFFKYFSPYLAIALIVVFIIFVNRVGYIQYMGLCEMFLFPLCGIGYIIDVIRSIRDFKSLEDERYDSSCIRTTYDSSTNSFVTSSSTETVGDDHFGEKMLLFITYPFWGIFVYLYRIIKYHRDINIACTKEIRAAYNKTIEETEKFILPNNIQKMFWLKEEKYKKSRQQIISKYKYLGEDQVKIQIKKLRKPAITLRSNKTIYRLLFNVDNISLVVNKLGAKKKKVLFNNYAIYSEDEKYIVDLFDFVNENIESGKRQTIYTIRGILKRHTFK